MSTHRWKISDAEKWDDEWFVELEDEWQRLFIYLCDRCDKAGYLKMNYRTIEFQTGLNHSKVLKGVERLSIPFKGVQRCYLRKMAEDRDDEVLWLRNHAKIQAHGTRVLNPNNNFHKSIIKDLLNYSSLFPEVEKVYRCSKVSKGVEQCSTVLREIEREKKIKISNKIKNKGESEGDDEKRDTIRTEPWTGDPADIAGAEKNDTYALMLEETMCNVTYAQYRKLQDCYPKIVNETRAVTKFLIALEGSPTGITNQVSYLGKIMSSQEVEDLETGAKVDSALKDGHTKNADGLVWRYKAWRKPEIEMTEEELDDEIQEVAG